MVENSDTFYDNEKHRGNSPSDDESENTNVFAREALNSAQWG